MNLLKWEQARASDVHTQALNVIPQVEKEQLKRKPNIPYFFAIEKLPFAKFPQLCDGSFTFR